MILPPSADGTLESPAPPPPPPPSHPTVGHTRCSHEQLLAAMQEAAADVLPPKGKPSPPWFTASEATLLPLIAKRAAALDANRRAPGPPPPAYPPPAGTPAAAMQLQRKYSAKV